MSECCILRKGSLWSMRRPFLCNSGGILCNASSTHLCSEIFLSSVLVASPFGQSSAQ
jgi:hypothetical protein